MNWPERQSFYNLPFKSKGMMATTHGYAGLAVAAGVAVQWPEFGVAAAFGGIVGGIAPDADVIGTHRRSFHFPVYFSLLSIPTVLAAVLWPSGLSVALAVGVIAAGIHSISDIIGGSADPRPWASASDRAVYVHPTGRWVQAREWIRYDGAPEDFLLGAVLAFPSLFVFRGEPVLVGLAVSGLVASGVYAAFRKPIGRHIERVQQGSVTERSD